MTHEAVNAMTVLITTRYCWSSVAKAPLKLGQNIQRKIVPIMANMSEVLVEPALKCSTGSWQIFPENLPWHGPWRWVVGIAFLCVNGPLHPNHHHRIARCSIFFDRLDEWKPHQKWFRRFLVIKHGLRLGLVENVTTNQYVVTAAGSFKTGSKDAKGKQQIVGCLLKLECNPSNNKVREMFVSCCCCLKLVWVLFGDSLI